MTWPTGLLLLLICCVVAIGLPVSWLRTSSFLTGAGQARIPSPDGLLHVYGLPVGQGDATVVQCPSGDLSIIDLGSSDNVKNGFWNVAELNDFFQGQFDRIRNVILTHNHFDHYNFIPDVLNPNTADISRLKEIYISCTYDNMVAVMQTWLGLFPNGQSMLRLFNGGQTCGPNGIPCETINLCPSDPDVIVKVMGANLGQQCTGGNKNIDSTVIKVTYGDVSIMFNGDFEDFTTSWTEDGPQKSMVDYYGSEMQVTIYQIAHHGAQTLANKPISRDAVKPKAVFVSGNPWFSYNHPRCAITDAFINYVMSLCKPEVTDTANAFYCGTAHPFDNTPVEDKVQRTYTCGFSNGTLRTVYDNEWAMYSTVPDNSTLNVVELLTDGTLWGFINNYSTRYGTPVLDYTGYDEHED